MVTPTQLLGQRFGRLLVVERAENDRFGKARWRCRCDCGHETTTRANTLRKGETKSCGCLRDETIGAARRTHGAARSPVYRVWSTMKARCQNPNDPNYASYGGRGITVCEAWQTFEAFAQDMGERPPGMTLGRIDNNGSYTPENCQWETHTQQMRNRRGNVSLTFRGDTRTLAEWAERQGLDPAALHWRIRAAKWSVERALTTPSTPPKGEAHPGAKLTDDAIHAIRAEYVSGRTQAALASQYGVQQSHISRIVNRKARY